VGARWYGWVDTGTAYILSVSVRSFAENPASIRDPGSMLSLLAGSLRLAAYLPLLGIVPWRTIAPPAHRPNFIFRTAWRFDRRAAPLPPKSSPSRKKQKKKGGVLLLRPSNRQ
jgi:hypothetical protein